MALLVTNPKTGRDITIGLGTYKKLIKEGYVLAIDWHSSDSKVVLRNPMNNILDQVVPDIQVEPLKPTGGSISSNTSRQKFKNTIVNNASSIADWLWKFAENRKKNVNEIADWILTQTDKVIKKVLPPKVEELIELSKRTLYNFNKIYWKINNPSNPRYESLILDKVEEAQHAYEKEYFNKYLKMHYYNHITSLDEIHKNLMKTYKDENNAFKLLISFGYITEKKKDITEGSKEYSGDYEIKLYQASQQYFYDKPQIIKNKSDMTNLVSKITGETVIHRLANKFPDTKTRLIGVYSMAVKVIRLDFPIGAKIQLPNYIKKSNHIIGLEDVDNNFCFWACLALAEGCTKNRYTKKAKELFNKFYKTNLKQFDDYKGFDFVNELDKYEAFNTKYAINIVNYYEDGSIEYVRRSEFNDESTRTSIYLNLYLDHFSYVPNLDKLAKKYVCNRCSAKFDNNFNLARHIDTCSLEQQDTFVKYPQIYERKRNDIVELCDWFNVEDVDYKYDYLIAFDLEAMLQKVVETKKNKEGEDAKLQYVTKHIPVSASIATNVPGFETEYFILSTNPHDIAGLMFEYFDKVVEKATELMKWKMRSLIFKVGDHYNEKEKEKWLHNIFKYCSNIPIVGFNTGFYDINLLSNYGFMEEIFKRDTNPFIIKNGTRYKAIKTERFTFLDQMNYCAAGTDLRKFIKAYDIDEQKGYFPYEWFDCYEKLDYLIRDLKREDFNSSLKNTTMDENDFKELMQTCSKLNLIYVKDLLKWYNNLDVRPMLKACLKQKEFYYSFDLDMYKDGFTLPALSETILFQFAQQGFNEYLKLKPVVDGGSYFCPNNIHNKIDSYKEQDIKAERPLDNYIEKAEVMELFKKQPYYCYYCWILLTNSNWSLDRIDCSKAHTSGNCIIACIDCNRQRSDTFMPKFYRQKALLRFAKKHPMIYLIDEKNKRVFYKIKNNIVGGPSIVYHRYHEKGKTNIDRVHYNTATKQWYYNNNGKVVEEIVGYDANALYLYCLEQDQLCGKLEWIPTEEEYKIEYEAETKDLNDEEKKVYENDRQLSTESKKIQKEISGKKLKWLTTFFGLVELDLNIPQDKYEYFGEMPPIFKNVEYSEEKGGEYMKEVISNIRKNDIDGKFATSRKLIATLRATRILIKSTRLKWLLKKGANITKIYGVIPAERGKPFKEFADWVSDERRKGDVETRYYIIGEGAKTVGNSAYGGTMMNKNKFSKVRFCDEKQFNRAKNNYFFTDVEEYDGIYEVSSRARTVKQNIPIQVAFSVLDDAKLRMLQFYYDFIDKYIERSDYQYMYMDTDSAYMALSDSFEKLIKPELRKEFELERNKWFPQTDTPENAAYDKRKPGLFKEEYNGDGMVALCSKMYYCWGCKDKKDKYSSKGTQQTRNKDILNKENYKSCLDKSETINCQNGGIRYIGKAMKTYVQDKIGLSPVYVKGIVMNDGNHIHPLVI
jgi:hypothetical protein